MVVVAWKNVSLSEELNGQYNLFSPGEAVLIKDFQALRSYTKQGFKLFEKVKKEILTYGEEISFSLFSRYQEVLEEFIVGYFRLYDYFSLEEILENYETESNEYHTLGRYFLFFLHTFVYKDSIIHRLNESLFIQMENFISHDFVPYRKEYDKTVLAEIKKRKNLRVENYLVYDGELFKDLLTSIVSLKTEQSNSLVFDSELAIKDAVVCFLEDKDYRKSIFEQHELSENKEEKNGFISIALLEYLDQYGYEEEKNFPSSSIKKRIEEMEDLVVLCFSRTFQLSTHQELVYEMIKEKVALRVQTYVRDEAPKLFTMLKNYKELETFFASCKKRVISEYSSELPEVYSKEEVKMKLEVFLVSVLYHTRSFEKENIPLFVPSLKEERNMVFTLALSYLYLFVYSVSVDCAYEDSFVCRLEKYIGSSNDFQIYDPNLCKAKSILYTRENLRMLSDVGQARKILKKMHI